MIAHAIEESVGSKPDVERVLLAHGGGGELMSRLIREHVVPPLDNERLSPLTDGAVLPAINTNVVFTTDSYVVTPLEFPGGDIGRLAVCGTVNDLAVMGAEPVALSLGLIAEEGLSFAMLDRILQSISAAAREAGVQIVTGDTKVIERRNTQPDRADIADAAARGFDSGEFAAEGLFVNTAGIGRLMPESRLDVRRVRAGDVVIVSGTIGDHGLAVMSRRRGVEFETALKSDAAPLNGMIATVLRGGGDVKFLRDATRGGLAGVLADLSENSRLSVEVHEERIPATAAARRAADMLGLDLLTVANEGKVVAVASPEDADQVVRIMRRHPLGQNAACIGTLTDATPPLVELVTRIGGRRVVPRPYGEELPRIC